MLTAKQELFVQNLVKGLSQREAYKQSYPKSKKWKDSSIDCEASKLFNSPKVLQRYNELIDKADDKAIMSAIERKIWLTKVINGEIKEDMPIMTDINKNDEVNTIKCPTKLDTRLKALDTLNKMEGEYIQDIRLSGNKDNPLVAQISTIDSVAKQLLDVNEDDIDVGINS